MRTIQQMISAEVCYCVSSLVSTLAQGGVTAIGQGGRDLSDLIEQATELASHITDWAETAGDAGWTETDGEWSRDANPDDDTDSDVIVVDSPITACERDGLDPYQTEVFEHWIVSDWLADQLEAHGEKVDRDFAGLTVWARTTTGQAIYADAVIERIYAETHKAEPTAWLTGAALDAATNPNT